MGCSLFSVFWYDFMHKHMSSPFLLNNHLTFSLKLNLKRTLIVVSIRFEIEEYHSDDVLGYHIDDTKSFVGQLDNRLRGGGMPQFGQI